LLQLVTLSAPGRDRNRGRIDAIVSPEAPQCWHQLARTLQPKELARDLVVKERVTSCAGHAKGNATRMPTFEKPLESTT